MLEYPSIQVIGKGTSKKVFERLINEAFDKLEGSGKGHINNVTTTNIHHFKPAFLDEVAVSNSGPGLIVCFNLTVPLLPAHTMKAP